MRSLIRRPLGVAIIGTGRISDLHVIEYLRDPRSRITALCDRDPERARNKAHAWGLDDVAIADDPEDILRRDDVDLVEILLPHHLHLPVALRAIETGKIVSLQKPMCLDMEEADRLVEAAEAHDRPFRVFENILFDNPVLIATSIIDEGGIGTPLSIRMKSNPGKGADAWEVPRSARAWRQKKELSGGGPMIFDDGHHKFAMAWYFMGEPEEVHAFVGHVEDEERGMLDAPAIVSFRFPNQRIGNLEIVHSPELEIATRHYAQDDRVEITGTHGVIWMNRGHGQIGDLPTVLHYRDGLTAEALEVGPGWQESFTESTRHFLDVIETGEEPLLTARDARSVLRFALAAEESARLGRSVAY